MEKEPQPESMSTVTIKPEYAPSEYSSEPPPAYVKPKSASVQVAKIVAVTVVLTSIVLGGFILASAYVSANAACRQFEQELELLSEAADRLQPVPQPEALVQDEPSAHSKRSSPNSIDDDAKDGDDASSEEPSDGSESSSSSSSEDEERPSDGGRSQFDLEQLASHLLEKNQKTKMNCVVEKKRAEEVVDHKPKTIRLPFGVNLTTDPRLEVRSGERMVIVCESGTVKSSPQPSRRPDEEDDDSSATSSSSSSDQDDEEGDTIMIQPVMIPIPQTRYETHMNQRMPPPPQFMQIQIQPDQLQQIQMQPQQIQMQPQQQQQQQQQPDFPPNPILRHIVQQIIAQKIMEAQRAREEQMMMQQQQQQQQQQEEIPRLPHRFQVAPPPPPPQQQQPQAYPQRFPIPEEVLTQLNRLPNRDVIVAVSSESDSSEEGPEARTASEEQPQAVQQPGVQRMVPQEIRLVPHRVTLVAQEPQQELRVPRPADVDESNPQMVRMVPQEVRFVQEQRQGAAEVNGRQAYGRAIPVQMMAPQEQEQEEAQPQQQQVQMQQVVEESRPHYLQPRSVPMMEV